MNKFIKRILKQIIPLKIQVLLKKKYIRYKENKKKYEIKRLLSTIKCLENKNNPKNIISLTSYGKRLSSTAPYAIITLLNQSVKPDKIILWVAYEDKEKIPSIIKKMEKKGVEIRFCQDIKSYKKLIPALEEFPEDHIITADDDIYYHCNWLEEIMALRLINQKKIICRRAHKIRVDINHNILPYSKWDKFISLDNNYDNDSVFPVGVGGISYPPKCFHKEVLNKELFTKLAPYADDIWFWAMAIINEDYFGEESPYILIPSKYSHNSQIIESEKQKEKGYALWHFNVLENGNDKQLNAVIENYPQIRKILQKIPPYKI